MMIFSATCRPDLPWLCILSSAGIFIGDLFSPTEKTARLTAEFSRGDRLRKQSL